MRLTYVKLGVLGIGILFTLLASLGLYAQWNSVQQPVAINLAALEEGEKPPSRYVRLENYVARKDHMFVGEYTYETATTYEYFYPVVSPSHPAAAGEAVPLTDFALVVRPNRVKFDSDDNPILPTGPLEGALAIGFDALEGIEIDYLRDTYPDMDVHQVQVLVPNQKPWVSVGSWIWLGFGIVVTLIGAASLLVSGDD